MSHYLKNLNDTASSKLLKKSSLTRICNNEFELCREKERNKKKLEFSTLAILTLFSQEIFSDSLVGSEANQTLH
jgi:hypothetical protein